MFNIPLSPHPEGAHKNGLEPQKSEGGLAVETEANTSLGERANPTEKSADRDGAPEIGFGPVYEEAQEHQPRHSQNIGQDTLGTPFMPQRDFAGYPGADISDRAVTHFGLPSQQAKADPTQFAAARSLQTGLYPGFETANTTPEHAPDNWSVARNQDEVPTPVTARASQHQTRSDTVAKATLSGSVLTNAETKQNIAPPLSEGVTLSDQSEKVASAHMQAGEPTPKSTRVPREHDVKAADKASHNDAVLREQTRTAPRQNASEGRATAEAPQLEKLDGSQFLAPASSGKTRPPSEQAEGIIAPLHTAPSTPGKTGTEYSQPRQQTDAFGAQSRGDGSGTFLQNFQSSVAHSTPTLATATTEQSVSETSGNLFSRATGREQPPADMPAAAAKEFTSAQPSQSATTTPFTHTTAPQRQPDRADTNLSTAPASPAVASAAGTQQAAQKTLIQQNWRNEKNAATSFHFESDAAMQGSARSDIPHVELSGTSNSSQDAPMKLPAQTQNTAAYHAAEGAVPSVVSGAADPAQPMPEIVEELGLNSAIDETRGDSTTNRTTQAQRADVPPRPVVQIAEAARQLSDKPIEIALSPEELGKVRLTLQMTEGQSLQIVVAAERAETLELLRRNIDSLMSEFKELGYENNGFSFQSFDQNTDGEQGSFSDEEGSPNTAAMQNTDRPAPSNDDVTRISLGAGRGIDIRL